MGDDEPSRRYACLPQLSRFEEQDHRAVPGETAAPLAVICVFACLSTLQCCAEVKKPVSALACSRKPVHPCCFVVSAASRCTGKWVPTHVVLCSVLTRSAAVPVVWASAVHHRPLSTCRLV